MASSHQCNAEACQENEATGAGARHDEDENRQQQVTEPFRRKRPADVVEAQMIGDTPGLDEQQVLRDERRVVALRLGGDHQPELDRHADDDEKGKGCEIERIEPHEPLQEEDPVIGPVRQLVAIAQQDEKAGDHEEHVEQRQQTFEHVRQRLLISRPIAQEVIEHHQKRGDQAPCLEDPEMHRPTTCNRPAETSGTTFQSP